MIGKDEMKELQPFINTEDILGGVWIPQVDIDREVIRICCQKNMEYKRLMA